MKIIDKLMDALSLYDEYDEEEELLEEEQPAKKQTEPEQPKKSLWSRSKQQEETKTAAEKPEEKPVKRGGILSFRNPAAKTESSQPEKMTAKTIQLPTTDKQVTVVVLEPVNFDDSLKVADYLRGNQAVIINFANTDDVIAKRMTDYISGTIYALNGSMRKQGRNILVCAPKNFDIDAELGADADKEMRGQKPWEKK